MPLQNSKGNPSAVVYGGGVGGKVLQTSPFISRNMPIVTMER